MRLLVAAAVALVLSMRGADIERAQAVARAREPERQQFHRRYVIDLTGPAVTQIEVTTEFRRLVLIAEEHVLRGDSMFTRSSRAAEQALAPTRGIVTITAQVRFNPLNAFVEAPPYAIAVGDPATNQFDALVTEVLPRYSAPFKGRDKKPLSSLIGATLEATVEAPRLGQSTRTIAVTLDGTTVAETTFDFARLD